MKILIVEDERELSDSIAAYLGVENYLCEQAFTYADAKMKLGIYEYDCVLLDLMLPGGDGLDLLRYMRGRRNPADVIIISAKDSLDDKVKGLGIGADDYLTKPFDLDELVARIAVQLRHRHRAAAEGRTGALRFGAWELDPSSKTFHVAGTPIELTRIELAILELLMRHPSRVFSKQELFEGAWGEPYAADDNTLNVHISNIRAKLRPSGTDTYLKTVWGMGFKLIEP